MRSLASGKVNSTVLTALLVLVAAGGCEPEARRPVIGVATSAAYIDAASLALDDAARDRPLPVDTVVRPEVSNRAAPALGKAEEFVRTPGIAAVVGHSNSSASLATSQIYNAREVVQIAPTASAGVYSDAGPYSFRLVPPDDRQGAFLAPVIRDSLPAGASLAILYVNDDYGRGLRASVLEAMTRLGLDRPIALDMPHTESIGSDGEEARAQLIGSLEASGAGAILWLGRATSLHEVLPGLRDRLGDIPVLGGDAVGAGWHMNEDGRWTGIRYVDLADLAATRDGRRFADRYQDRFGRHAGGAEALTHDAMAILLAAVDSGARTGPEIREYLLSLGRQRPPFQGVTGPIQFDERGDVERSYHLTVIREPQGQERQDQ